MNPSQSFGVFLSLCVSLRVHADISSHCSAYAIILTYIYVPVWIFFN